MYNINNVTNKILSLETTTTQINYSKNFTQINYYVLLFGGDRDLFYIHKTWKQIEE